MEALIARAVHLVLAVSIAYYLALWFALVVWTFQDVQARTRSVLAQIFATLLVVLFSVPGVLLYLLLRPKETLEDVYQRSLEEEYLLQDLGTFALCPHCQHVVHEDFLYCPTCRNQIRHGCAACGRLIDLRWAICPYCGHEQEAEALVTTEESRWALPGLSRLTRQLRRAESEPTLDQSYQSEPAVLGDRDGRVLPRTASLADEDTSEIRPTTSR